MRKSLFCCPLITVCSAICLFATGCGGGGGSPLPPPAAVTGLSYVRTSTAPPGPGTVRLTWNPGSTRTTKGYLVGRKLQGESSFHALMTTPFTTPSYEDHLPQGQEIGTPTYQVVLVDKKNRISSPTEVQAVVSAPDPPSEFSGP
jgi:hypothetical protein